MQQIKIKEEGFKKKLVIGNTILCLCFVLAMNVFAKVHLQQVMLSSVEKEIQGFLETLSTKKDFETVLQELKEQENFLEISLYDSSNNVIYASKNKQLFSSNKEVVEALEKNSSIYVRKDVAYICKKFSFQNRTYLLHTSIHLGTTILLQHWFKSHFAFFVMGYLFIYGLISWVVLYFLFKPIKKMAVFFKQGVYRQGENTKCFLGFSSLVSRVKTQLQSKREEKNEQEGILEVLGEGIIALDKEKRITFINSTASLFLGKEKEKIVREFLYNIKDSYGLIEKCETLLQPCLDGEEKVRGSIVLEKIPKVYLDVCIVRKITQEGFVIVLQDRTADYKVLSMGKDFVANASHELRTPITIIQGFAETLATQPNLPEKVLQEVSEKIVKTAKRLGNIIHDLLMLESIEKLRTSLEECDLSFLLEKQTQQILSQHKKTTVSLEKEEKNIFVRGNTGLLELAVTNLLENAIRYSEKDPKIVVKLFRDDKEIKLQIIDQGIGIPEQDLEHIFDRFYTVDKARSKKLGGTGLGLSLVKTIVEKHRGKVFVSSQLGQGSCFTLLFPLEEIV
jgi:signal transduction histidine kinase